MSLFLLVFGTVLVRLILKYFLHIYCMILNKISYFSSVFIIYIQLDVEKKYNLEIYRYSVFFINATCIKLEIFTLLIQDDVLVHVCDVFIVLRHIYSTCSHFPNCDNYCHFAITPYLGPRVLSPLTALPSQSFWCTVLWFTHKDVRVVLQHRPANHKQELCHVL